jgi:hypothetical protein
MNLQDERTKGIIAVAVIVIALLFMFIQIRRRLAPASTAPSVASTAGTSSPGSSTVPPSPAGTTAATVGTAPATTAGTTSGSAVANKAAEPVMPNGPFKIVVRDPFVTTPTYRREIVKGGDTGVNSGGKSAAANEPAPSIQSSLPPLTSGGLTSTLPPANTGDMKIFPPLPTMKKEPPTQTAQSTNPLPSTTGSAPVVPPKPEVSFALTGTVEGDVPMAILRSKDRSYLVREGDWLEGDFQVRRISPKQVVLRDRSGHSRILNLGVVTDAT